MEKPKLSIVIITLNEQHWIKRILDSLDKQTFKDYEIIVADYNSTDKTREIAKGYGCKITEGGGYSKGRNNGARIAKAKYLLFLDADYLLPKNFLKTNFNEFKKSKCGVGTTDIKPISDKYFDKIFFSLYNYWSKLMKNISPHCCTAIFCKKDVFQKINGFNENICFAENHDFSRRASKYGFIILPKEAYTSVRRLDKDGRLKFVFKYIYAGLYRMFYKEINKELFEYDKECK